MLENVILFKNDIIKDFAIMVKRSHFYLAQRDPLLTLVTNSLAMILVLSGKYDVHEMHPFLWVRIEPSTSC